MNSSHLMIDWRSCFNHTQCVWFPLNLLPSNFCTIILAIGFNVETVEVSSVLQSHCLLTHTLFKYKNIKFQVWDLGGQSSIRCGNSLIFIHSIGFAELHARPYWRCYFPNTSAIIYVIDASDQARLATSRTELLTMLSEEELKGVPLLVFCNKQDVPGALKPEDISEKLGLAGGEKSRPWSVRGSCATKGEGLEDGLDWCVTMFSFNTNSNHRIG
jgi:ADP-ribosylation factor family